MLQRLMSSPARLANVIGEDISGTIAIKFAVLAPVLLGVMATGLDIAFAYSRQAQLQAAVDAAVLAGAKELSLSDTKRENVPEIVKAIVVNYVGANHTDSTTAGGGGSGSGGAGKSGSGSALASAPSSGGSGGNSGGGNLSVETEVLGEPLQVSSVVKEKFSTLLLPFFGYNDLSVEVKAVARVAGRPNICVLSLDDSANRAISLEHQARVTGQDCAVFANSSHSNAIIAKNSATMKASFICSRGGKSGGAGSFDPIPMTDCPSFDDPLAGRPEPEPDGCMETKLVLQGFIGSLLPGTYCGGLKLEAGTNVVMTPGIYVFKDGPLIVEDGASLTGVGVGLFFTGQDAYFAFEDQTTISLAAPATGLMAGMLMFESRSQPEKYRFELMSNDAPVLLGTIYLPRGELHIDAESPIAQESAYTAIVARTMRLYGGPHLVLRTDYDQTDVPVPKGIKGAGQPVALVE